MELEGKIRSLLELDKFSNLSSQEKEFVFQSILANCLILSKKNQERYLNLIKDNLVEIINLKDKNYHKDGVCYGGIVEASVIGKPLDPENTIYPFNYQLKYREYDTPIGKMTKSILHEFGHLTVKKDSFKLTETSVLIDMGGLIISKLLEDEYGHMLTEIINEFTTFLAYKAFLSYRTPNEESNKKLKAYAEKMGLSVEEVCEGLRILPDDLFTSYTEEALSSVKLDDGTERMFNPLYVKYSPLVRLMMLTFQNPLFSYDDLRKEFEKGNGLSAEINNIPINDLLYSYYESSFHIQNLFDSVLEKSGIWRKFCLEFDSKMMDTRLDENFIASSIELFLDFYQRRLKLMIRDNLLTEEEAMRKFEQLELVANNCKAYYDSIKGKTFK